MWFVGCCICMVFGFVCNGIEVVMILYFEFVEIVLFVVDVYFMFFFDWFEGFES